MNPFFVREFIYLPAQRMIGGNARELIRFHQELMQRPETAPKRNREKALLALLESVGRRISYYQRMLADGEPGICTILYIRYQT